MRAQRSFVSWVLAAGVQALLGSTCFALDVRDDSRPSVPLQMEIRSGGVLEESHVYHRNPALHMAGPTGSVVPASGWYGYGFPVQTYRWGWFGAEHYYPTVWWHDGYHGDCCRVAYRRGY